MNISTHIKKICKNKILFPAAVCIIIIAILIICPFIKVFHPDNIKNIFNVTNDDSYVEVTIPKLNYTGYSLTKTGSRKFGYYYISQNNKYFFVLVPTNSTPKKQLTNYTFKGKVIKENKSYNNMLKKYASDLNWDYDSIKKVSFNFLISSADYHGVFFLILFWVALVIFFVALKILISAVMGWTNPYYYPVYSLFSKKERHNLIDQAQRELDSDNYLCINSMFITENYFIDLGQKEVSIIPLNQIIWCYRLGSVFLAPKVGVPEFAIYFTTVDGNVVTAKHKTSDESLEIISAIRATGYKIIFGHSDNKRKRAKHIVERHKNKN